MADGMLFGYQGRFRQAVDAKTVLTIVKKDQRRKFYRKRASAHSAAGSLLFSRGEFT
ncbi:hypothetical protein V1499_05005 [Neobacillus sp. SCS-31]|uniref:hypothetical protein n=1 Tax=Neobacillus oceani TaxID=3115292 RepID=UPI003905C2FC